LATIIHLSELAQINQTLADGYYVGALRLETRARILMQLTASNEDDMAIAAAEVTGRKPQPSGHRVTLTIREACDTSGLSRSTINRLLWAKKLTAVRIGRRVLIHNDTLQRLLLEGEV
jgi:excisionase family DNA binding protein